MKKICRVCLGSMSHASLVKLPHTPESGQTGLSGLERLGGITRTCRVPVCPGNPDSGIVNSLVVGRELTRDGFEPPTPAFSEQAHLGQSTTYNFT